MFFSCIGKFIFVKFNLLVYLIYLEIFFIWWVEGCSVDKIVYWKYFWLLFWMLIIVFLVFNLIGSGMKFDFCMGLYLVIFRVKFIILLSV